MISDRLQMIAKMLDKGAIIADIGSDHALLPCYLVLNDISSKVYAVDNKPGPMQGALENISKYQLEGKVLPILASGLDELADDVSSIIIAGMGFDTIKMILMDNLDKALDLDSLVIQANTDWHLLRSLLKENNFSIVEENFLISRNKEYLFIKAVPSKVSNIKNTYVGDLLMDDINYLKFLKEQEELFCGISQFNDDIKDLHSNIKQALDTMN
ncbi:MAG: SAM-dependent methyltransferase [Erysipelothrix sp.]|nr:SAM-dependent methyltransferase [Erysipelothrix sp.]